MVPLVLLRTSYLFVLLGVADMGCASGLGQHEEDSEASPGLRRGRWEPAEDESHRQHRVAKKDGTRALEILLVGIRHWFGSNKLLKQGCSRGASSPAGETFPAEGATVQRGTQVTLAEQRPCPGGEASLH